MWGPSMALADSGPLMDLGVVAAWGSLPSPSPPLIQGSQLPHHRWEGSASPLQDLCPGPGHHVESRVTHSKIHHQTSPPCPHYYDRSSPPMQR